MKNTIQKIASGARKGLTTLLIPVALGVAVGGCSERQFNGKIEKESFYPGAAGGGFLDPPDRYIALIRADDGSYVTVSYMMSKAREADLIFNPGDKITVKEQTILGGKQYTIIIGKTQ